MREGEHDMIAIRDRFKAGHAVKLWVLLLGVGAWMGCSSPTASSSARVTKIADVAKPLTKEQAMHATVKKNALVFPINTANMDLLGSTGKVLMSGEGDGFLRLVNAVAMDVPNGSITLTTTDAALTDVVEDGTTAATFDLATGTVEPPVEPQSWKPGPDRRPQSARSSSEGFSR